MSGPMHTCQATPTAQTSSPALTGLHSRVSCVHGLQNHTDVLLQPVYGGRFFPQKVRSPKVQAHQLAQSRWLAGGEWAW